MILFSSLHVGQLLSFERFSQSFSSKEAFSFTEKLPKIRSRYVNKLIGLVIFRNFSEHGAVAVRKFLGCLLFEAFM